MSLTLRRLCGDDEAQARALHAQLAEEGFDFLLAEGSWDEILRFHADAENGINLPADFVPATFRVAEVDGDIVGRVSIRHELNEHLAAFGGHVGYAVGKKYRRRGYATQMLRQAVDMLRLMGVDRVLVTCDDDNIGSVKTIEACGGKLQDKVDGNGGTLTRRYRI